MKSKVKSIGFNREWKGEAKEGKPAFTNYYFNIEWESGDIGQFVTNKRDQTKFVIGQEYEFKVSKLDKNNNKIFDIVKEPFIPGKSNYNDPLNNVKTSMSVCQSAAINMYNIVHKEGKNSNMQIIANKFHEWVIKNGTEKSILSLRWNAITRAVEQISQMSPTKLETLIKEHKLTDEVIANADFFMKFVDQTTV